jgi:hypothetical protein
VVQHQCGVDEVERRALGVDERRHIDPVELRDEGHRAQGGARRGKHLRGDVHTAVGAQWQSGEHRCHLCEIAAAEIEKMGSALPLGMVSQPCGEGAVARGR